jgi:hypothetical protein
VGSSLFSFNKISPGNPGRAEILMFCICAGRERRLDFPPMNLVLALLFFAGFAGVLGWGIVLLLAGSPWLLVAALLVFLAAFVKFGCLSHGD